MGWQLRLSRTLVRGLPPELGRLTGLRQVRAMRVARRASHRPVPPLVPASFGRISDSDGEDMAASQRALSAASALALHTRARTRTHTHTHKHTRARARKHTHHTDGCLTASSLRRFGRFSLGFSVIWCGGVQLDLAGCAELVWPPPAVVAAGLPVLLDYLRCVISPFLSE